MLFVNLDWQGNRGDAGLLAVLVRHSIQMLIADVMVWLWKVWIKPDSNKNMLFPNSAMANNGAIAMHATNS
jgi:hypothetical protein